MTLEISKNIEAANTPDGGDYTIIKAGEAVVGFTFSVDPQSKTGTITPCLYRRNGTQIHSMYIPPITVSNENVFINNEGITEKDAYDTHLSSLTPSAATLDLLLRTRIGGKALSEFVIRPAQKG